MLTKYKLYKIKMTGILKIKKSQKEKKENENDKENKVKNELVLKCFKMFGFEDR